MPTETRFYSVETPSFFREIELPADDEAWTAAQTRKYEKLRDLAEAHGTHVTATSYRRG